MTWRGRPNHKTAMRNGTKVIVDIDIAQWEGTVDGFTTEKNECGFGPNYRVRRADNGLCDLVYWDSVHPRKE